MSRPGAIPVTLGLDAGTVRVGLAATDPTATIAGPVATLSRRNGAALWERVREEARTRGAERLVVGLPRRMDGTEGDAAAAARALAEEASRQTGLPVEMWDERLTTVAAERALVDAGMRREKRRQTVDAVAAALMLQGWLDAARGKAVSRITVKSAAGLQGQGCHRASDEWPGGVPHESESPLRARQRPERRRRG